MARRLRAAGCGDSGVRRGEGCKIKRACGQAAVEHLGDCAHWPQTPAGTSITGKLVKRMLPRPHLQTSDLVGPGGLEESAPRKHSG